LLQLTKGGDTQMSSQKLENKPLTEVTLEGFRSINSLQKFKLEKINVFIGANGAGKSNLIGMFHLLSASARGYLQQFVAERGGANRLLHFGRKITSHIKIELNFDNLNGYSIDLFPDDQDTIFYNSESCWFWDKTKHEKRFDIPLGSGHKESKLKQSSDQQKIAKHVYSRLESWRIYHFHDTGQSSLLKVKQPISDNEFLRPNGSNLAPFLYHLKLKYKSEYEAILRAVRFVAPFIREFKLHPDRIDPNFMMLEWAHVKTDAYFNANDLSDGTLRFICLATLLLQPDPPSIIIMDEPELGLHPQAIQVLVEMMRQTNNRTNTQLIIATQSVTLVNHLNPSEVIITECKDGESTFRRLTTESLDQWLNQYNLGDLWEKNIFGGIPH
jgi:predicted ATPase